MKVTQEDKTSPSGSEKKLDWIDQLCLLDDIFFNAVFADSKECTQLVLRIILDMDDLTVISVNTQDTVRNIYGRSLRLDVLAKDDTGRMYNIEVQRADDGADARRARYHSSLLDASISEPGKKFTELVDTFVIFITENDVMKAGEPVYHIDKVVRETRKSFEDGTHIIYVNGAYESDNDIGKLMHDFRSIDPDDMYYDDLAVRSKQLKREEGGGTNMSSIYYELIDKAVNEAVNKAVHETEQRVRLETEQRVRLETEQRVRLEAEQKANQEAKEKTVEIAAGMLAMGTISHEDIARITKLSAEEVEQIAKQHSA